MAAALASGCKKYGYEFQDGFQDASGNEANVTVDTNAAMIDRSAYAKARAFPGLVGETEPRLNDVALTLDMNFTSQTAENLRISVAPQPWFSTGYYAAPGELVKLVVPAGVNGLAIQVGGHTSNLSHLSTLLRDPIVFTRKQLFPGVNYVRNPYGGYIYIIAKFAIPNPVEFRISGVCVAPDFVLGQTNDQQWFEQVRKSQVPWLELRCRSVVYLVRRESIIRKISSPNEPLDNPTALMTKWNEIFDEHFNKWMGLSPNAPDVRDRSPQGAWRGVVDIQLPSPSAVGIAGFPFQGLYGVSNDGWFETWSSLTQLVRGYSNHTNSDLSVPPTDADLQDPGYEGKFKNNWGTYHEFGHNCQQNTTWNWSALGEATNNLFSYKIAKAFGYKFKYLHAPNDWNTAGMAYVTSNSTTKNFDSDVTLNSFSRTIPFVQLLEKFDYGLMTYIYTRARHAPRLANNDQDKKDNFYEWACEYTKTDLIPFFQAWGITISAVSQRKIGSKGYPLLATQIWTYDIHEGTGGTGNIVYRYPLTVVSVSSQETSQGPAAGLVDNNASTFWHAQWSGTLPASSNYPFNLVFGIAPNTINIKPLRGVTITQRNSSGSYVKNVEVWVSNDNVNYTSVGLTSVPQNTTPYSFVFPDGAVNARYIKLEIKSGVASRTVALAEVEGIF